MCSIVSCYICLNSMVMSTTCTVLPTNSEFINMHKRDINSICNSHQCGCWPVLVHQLSCAGCMMQLQYMTSKQFCSVSAAA